MHEMLDLKPALLNRFRLVLGFTLFKMDAEYPKTKRNRQGYGVSSCV